MELSSEAKFRRPDIFRYDWYFVAPEEGVWSENLENTGLFLATDRAMVAPEFLPWWNPQASPGARPRTGVPSDGKFLDSEKSSLDREKIEVSPIRHSGNADLSDPMSDL